MKTPLNLYCLHWKNFNEYDQYDAIIVAAETPKEAKRIQPSEGDNEGSWASSPNEISAKLIGVAKIGTKKGVILASYNAG